MNITDQTECRNAYAAAGITITDNMVCAAGVNCNGQNDDTCQGDSGGPLVNLFNGAWELVGATSFGIGCADSRFHGVYADIYANRDWILEVIGNDCARA